MATALPIDKELVKSLWLQGFTAPKIAEKTGVKIGTIRAWVARGRWKQLGARIRVENQNAQTTACKDVAERLAIATIEQAERIIRVMRDRKIYTLSECKLAATALAAAYATGRKALGVDDEISSKHIHFHMRMDQDRPAATQLSLEQPVLDIQPEPESTQPADATLDPSATPIPEPPADD